MHALGLLRFCCGALLAVGMVAAEDAPLERTDSDARSGPQSPYCSGVMDPSDNSLECNAELGARNVAQSMYCTGVVDREKWWKECGNWGAKIEVTPFDFVDASRWPKGLSPFLFRVGETLAWVATEADGRARASCVAPLGEASEFLVINTASSLASSIGSTLALREKDDALWWVRETLHTHFGVCEVFEHCPGRIFFLGEHENENLAGPLSFLRPDGECSGPTGRFFLPRNGREPVVLRDNEEWIVRIEEWRPGDAEFYMWTFRIPVDGVSWSPNRGLEIVEVGSW